MRVDKFLWAVRIFKTRSLATKACKANQVLILGNSVKPSRELKVGDEIEVKKMPIWRKYRVKEILKNRVGAKLAPDYVTDITPSKELEHLEMLRVSGNANRQKGTGRPTKRERRTIDDLWSELDYQKDDDEEML